MQTTSWGVEHMLTGRCGGTSALILWRSPEVNVRSLFLQDANAKLKPPYRNIHFFVVLFKPEDLSVTVLAGGKFHTKGFRIQSSKASNMENGMETRFYKTSKQATMQLELVRTAATAGLVGELSSSSRPFQSYCGPAFLSFCGCNLTK